MAFRLADPKLIPEGIAFDAKNERFFIGTLYVTDSLGGTLFRKHCVPPLRLRFVEETIRASRRDCRNRMRW